DIASQNGQTLLRARDSYHSQPQDLLTVTELDAKLYGLSIAELAQQRQQQLQTELETALEARLPDAMARQIQQALRVLLITTGLSLGLGLLQRPMRRHAKTLRVQQALHQELETNGMAADVNADREPFRQAGLDNRSPAPEPEPAEPQKPLQATNGRDAAFTLPMATEPPIQNGSSHRFHFLDTLRSRFSLERRHSLNALLRWLLLWGQVTIWIVGITQILSIFPQSQALAARVWATPIALVLVWFATGAVNRLGDVIIDRFSHVLEEEEFFTFEGMQRKCLRLSTVMRVTKGVKTFGVYGAGCIWALNILGVPLGSLLTVSAAIALAVSLASQNLIKDLVNGVLILSEDQYGIGDFITVGTVTGLVENMNLRITQVRNAEGRLITIPNSLIAQVENLTRLWSRVDFTVEVAYDADLKEALALLDQVGQQLYSEPEWQPLLLKPPEVLGIEHLSHAGAQIRIWLQTQPLQQWKVGREFRLRVWQALTDHQIAIGMPQQILRSGPEDLLPELGQTALPKATGTHPSPL
ncbi:MAG: mechanosensitive ion channel family protein, partial [Elainella sp.]